MKKVPSSVYRLQLNEAFTLKDATKLLPYLKELGVEGVYCSPYFAAYSPHGYDIVDPTRLNPQVATPKDFDTFCKRLKELKLFHIADIVPNHMGIKGDNRWWQDVLEHGKDSKYASFFDIYWNGDKINIALLGVPFEEASIKTVKKGKKRFYQYGDQYFPFNTEHYRLVHWLSFAQEPSYRRFFNINELVGVRIEDKKVLEAHHKWIFELLKKGKIDGLRVDHPDGLYDPKSYFDELRKKHKGLIVVEKILGWGEELPPSWQVEGTVGYEYLNMLTGLFVKPSDKLTKVYSRFIGKEIDFEQLLLEKKKFYMVTEMAGDVKNLASKIPLHQDLTRGDLVLGVYKLLAAFPVYRSYIRPRGSIPKRDIPYLEEAFSKARRENRELGSRVFDYLEEIFTLKRDTPALRDFLMRFQQLSAPIMAKGFEDITLYNYNRL
ncbi:MAG: Maltooligosyl trehalose synthase, partial [Chlamydiae bacterium]|nr:Maltooligosyl trehalose synthase [Chlamydiota bacterium]